MWTRQSSILSPPTRRARGSRRVCTRGWYRLLESKAPPERAEFLARSGFTALALKSLQSEVASTTDAAARARCFFTAGRIRERMAQFDAAVRCYRAVEPERLNEEDRYFAENDLAYCLNRLGVHAEAEEACRRAIAVDGSRFNAHKNLGIALERTGRLAEAAGAYRTAAQAPDSDDRPLRHLRVLLANHPEIGRDHPDLAKDAEVAPRIAGGLAASFGRRTPGRARNMSGKC